MSEHKVHLKRPLSSILTATTCGQAPYTNDQQAALTRDPDEVTCKGCRNHKQFRSYALGWAAHKEHTT